MIELRDSRVFSFSPVEIARLKQQYKDRVEEGASWFSYYLEEAFPHYYHTVIQDYRSFAVYVIITSYVPGMDTMLELVTDEDGKKYERTFRITDMHL